MNCAQLISLIGFCLIYGVPATRGQECKGDFDGDGRVSIEELITAVHNALGGCTAAPATPTRTMAVMATATSRPDRCAFIDFNHVDAAGCRFEGPYDAAQDGCRNAAVGLTVAVVGGGIALTLETEPVAQFRGSPTDDPMTLRIRSYSVGASGPQPFAAAAHLLNLGQNLRIALASAPFSIDGCDFIDFMGSYSP